MSLPDDALAAEALRQGAQDFLVKRELADGLLARALHYAIARQRAQASLHFLSLVDELTGLHNRRGFVTLGEQHLKLTRRRGLRTSLVFVDLDDLKYINDSFGHREGDYALQQLGATARVFQRLRMSLAEGTTISARFFPTPRNPARRSFGSGCTVFWKSTMRRRNGAYRLSASLGVVEVNGPVGLEHDIARADALMYAQKRSKQKQGRTLSVAST